MTFSLAELPTELPTPHIHTHAIHTFHSTAQLWRHITLPWRPIPIPSILDSQYPRNISRLASLLTRQDTVAIGSSHSLPIPYHLANPMQHPFLPPYHIPSHARSNMRPRMQPSPGPWIEPWPGQSIVGFSPQCRGYPSREYTAQRFIRSMEIYSMHACLNSPGQSVSPPPIHAHRSTNLQHVH